MFHDVVELVKALAWPVVAVLFGFRFDKELRSLLLEMPAALRRIKSAHGLGIEIELDRLKGEVDEAAKETKTLQPEPEKAPEPITIEGEK